MLEVDRAILAVGITGNVEDLGLDGTGVEVDQEKAAHWFERAANQGLAKAQRHIGTRYAEGEGVPEDYAEAAKWYHLAAEQGDDGAQFTLGRL